MSILLVHSCCHFWYILICQFWYTVIYRLHAGRCLAYAWRHIWLLIFFVLFLSRQKGQKQNKVQTPLKALKTKERCLTHLSSIQNISKIYAISGISVNGLVILVFPKRFKSAASSSSLIFSLRSNSLTAGWLKPGIRLKKNGHNSSER